MRAALNVTEYLAASPASCYPRWHAWLSNRGMNVLGALEKPATSESLRGLLPCNTSSDQISILRSAPFTADGLGDAKTLVKINIHVQPKLNALSGKVGVVVVLARRFSSGRSMVQLSVFYVAEGWRPRSYGT